MVFVLLFFSYATQAQVQSKAPAQTVEQQKRLELMKSKGPEASLTILPCMLAGRPFDRLTEFIGLLLEQQGLKTIELGQSAFAPAEKTSMTALADSLAGFVKQHPVASEYVLYAELNGNRQTGLEEIRAMVLDKTGALVWADRQGPEDDAVKKLEAKEPMTFSMLLVERLGPNLGLTEETAKAAKPGKMARLMEERSGLPPQSERDPLPQRQEEMKKLGKKATMVVFPVRSGGAANAEAAKVLTTLLNKATLCKATLATQSPLLKASQADPNEQKILWDLAREFREYVRNNPVKADYALYADYVFNPQNWEQGFVHVVVCDGKGEWVIVDLANSHHPDYQSVKPTSIDGCNSLLLKRLESYLR